MTGSERTNSYILQPYVCVFKKLKYSVGQMCVLHSMSLSIKGTLADLKISQYVYVCIKAVP